MITMRSQLEMRWSTSPDDMGYGHKPVPELLGGKDLDTKCSAERIAHRILHRWLDMYEGNPEISHPTVEVIRDFEQAVATI